MAGAGSSPAGGTRSSLKIIVNVFISFIGAGVLGLPYAFRQAGVFEGILTMAVVSFFAVKAMLLIIECKYTIIAKHGSVDQTPLVSAKISDDSLNYQLSQNGSLPNGKSSAGHPITDNMSYSDVGYYAAGITGARVVDFAIVVSQIGFCCGYLIFISENLNSYLPTVTKETWLMLCLPLLFLLTLYRELHKLAFFSLFAQISNLMAFVVVFWFDFDEMAHGQKRMTNPKDWSLQGFPFFFCVAIYCYEGAGMILSLEYSVAKPVRQRFQRYFLLVMVFVTVLYISFGVCGYLSFGSRTNAIITLNLPSGSGFQFSMLVKLCLCFSLFFTYPVMMFPVTDLIERYLFNDRMSSRYFYENTLRLCLVLSTGLIVVGIPSFADLVALIGASCCTLLAFIMPGLFHMILHEKTLTRSEKLLDLWLIVIGTLGAIIGTLDTLSRLRDQSDTVVPVPAGHEIFAALNRSEIDRVFGSPTNQSILA